MEQDLILVINSGSSSLKFGLYAKRDGEEEHLVDGLADGIGRATGKLELRNETGRAVRSEQVQFDTEAEAFDHAAELLSEEGFSSPIAIGHRVVHGGPRLVSHQAITPKVLAELKACVHFAPLHIPIAVELIEKAKQRYAGVPQFACFDTAFHSTMPETASRFALPNDLYVEGIRRYGFHGLSYESIVYQLGTSLQSRTIVAHLGNGASLAAIQNGRSIDTTMGLTPTGGIPMATRSGDIDPGVILYLERNKGLEPESLEQLLNHKSGLTALSQGKADMRDLQAAAEGGDNSARLAIDVFCMAIRKTIAAYSAVLGGVDIIVFTGGIGEHSAQVRAEVCGGLSFLGVRLDGEGNKKNERTISSQDSKVAVCVLPAQEDQQIARHCRAMIKASSL